MYAGHFAIGLALKARHPTTPTLPLLIGVGFLDIVDGLFTMIGVNRVTADPSAGPYLFFDLSFIDWDHSLAMALAWSVLWGLLFARDRRVGVLAFVAAISHFAADWPLHNGDLALYPHSATHLGLGLWGRLGTGAWLLEGAFAAALSAWAFRAAARRGARWGWPCALVAVLFLDLSPWLSPMKFAAMLHEPALHLVHGALVAFGFLVPGLVMTWLVDRAERRAGPAAAPVSVRAA